MGMRNEIESRMRQYVVEQFALGKQRGLFRDKALDGWTRPWGASDGDVQQIVDETTDRIVKAINDALPQIIDQSVSAAQGA